MRFRTWPVAAFAVGALLLLVVVSVLESNRRAQEIYTRLDEVNQRYHEVEGKLRRLRSDVNMSGIFVVICSRCLPGACCSAGSSH